MIGGALELTEYSYMQTGKAINVDETTKSIWQCLPLIPIIGSSVWASANLLFAICLAYALSSKSNADNVVDEIN